MQHHRDGPTSQARTCLLVQREGFWPVASLFSCQDLVLQAWAPLPKAQQASQAVWLFQLAVDLLLIVPTSEGCHNVLIRLSLGLGHFISQGTWTLSWTLSTFQMLLKRLPVIAQTFDKTACAVFGWALTSLSSLS